MTSRRSGAKPPHDERYPPIGEYGLIGDCHSAGLVSRLGSIDWCCLPRFESGSCFGRLLGWDTGGYCSIGPKGRRSTSGRRYLDDTLVLCTTFVTGAGEVCVYDFFAMRKGGARDPLRLLLRIVEGVRGRMDLRMEIVPRFDYGEVRPWIRQQDVRLYSAIGGNDGLLIWSDADIATVDNHSLAADFSIRAGKRVRLSIQFVRPEELDVKDPKPPSPEELDRRFDETVAWWKRWIGRGRIPGPDAAGAMRSAMTLKAMTNAPTGAFVAAATTSLPEVLGGNRNWDYRFSWVRDSSFAVRSLAQLGFVAEADGFRRFIERSAAGSAEDLQVLYGPGGERRLTELELQELEGYRRSRPVRAGNGAARQLQLDVYGELVELSWRWHMRGFSPDDDYWRFLSELVDCAARRWQEPDRGIWEIRGRPKHFVHSKAMCWVALDRGLQLAKESGRRAPVKRWRQARKEIRNAVETRGYDRRRGVFVRSFGAKDLDAALLLLPEVGFVDHQDERMIRTVDAIREDLDEGRGLLMRYRSSDGLQGKEGAFLSCSFWLAECLARQGRMEDAREVFDTASSTGNDLGLFSEEFDPRTGELLGNFPQGLTHLSHIAAAVALSGN
jgi:GH15 family glucan-1,4-alpha-glucosidase